MKFATWAFQAWLVVREQQHLIRSTFVNTGFLIAKDGSENHLIQVSGCRGYDSKKLERSFAGDSFARVVFNYMYIYLVCTLRPNSAQKHFFPTSALKTRLFPP
jgi:hypothetical protein